MKKNIKLDAVPKGKLTVIKDFLPSVSQLARKKCHYLHPGEILKMDYLDEHGLSVKAAAEAMRIPRTRLNDIVRGRRGITANTALRLAQFFGGSAVFWTNLQSHYDLAEAKTAAGKALKTIRPVGAWLAEHADAHV